MKAAIREAKKAWAPLREKLLDRTRVDVRGQITVRG